MSTGRKIRVKSVPDVKFCLVFQCETLSVPVMRRVLGDTLRGLGVDEESVYDILLAATEACTNVLTHGGQQVRGYEVVTSLGAVGCQIEVADEGIGLPHKSHAVARAGRTREPRGTREPAPVAGHEHETPIAQLPESGRGLAVMRACVDQVTLDSQPGRGTVVTMRKHIRWSQDSPLRRHQKVSLSPARLRAPHPPPHSPFIASPSFVARSLILPRSPPGPLLGVAFPRRSFLAPQSRPRRGPFGSRGRGRFGPGGK